jgi:tetratricopeptide (TPR) repeat protein
VLRLSLDLIALSLEQSGNQAGAFENRQRSLAILEKLTANDPSRADWQSRLASVLESIASSLKQSGERVGALANRQRALAIREKLAATDSGRADWQWFLAVGLESIAPLLVDAGDPAGALANRQRSVIILETLTATDPARTQWVWGLAISLEGMARSLEDSGDRNGALEHLQRALTIREKLAAADAADSDKQDDVSTTLENIARVLLAGGDQAGAFASYQRSVAIREKLAAANPADTEAQVSLARSYSILGRLAGDSHDTSRDNLGKALAILKQLDREGRLAPGENSLMQSLEAAQERISAAQLLEVGDRTGAVAHYQKSLTIVEKLAATLMPDDLSFETNRAHALLSRGDEAKALYLAYKGRTMSDNQSWEQIIALDFAEFRKAGLIHPMMAEIESVLGIAPAER